LIVDLRLLGAGLKKESVVQLSAGAQPWLIAGITLMFASGIPLFFAESIKCYYSFPFWVKMTSLLLLIVFIFSVRRRVTQTDVAADRPLSGGVTAVISLLLLFAVAWGGRWIGFS
jgi:hypothetical protein